MTQRWVDSRLRQLVATIVVLGMLTVPVQCADVDHVHSIFESPTGSWNMAATGSHAHPSQSSGATVEHSHQSDLVDLLLAMDAGRYDPAATDLGVVDGAEIPDSEPVQKSFDRNDVPSLPRAQELLVSPMIGGLSALLAAAVIIVAAMLGEVALFPAARRLTGWKDSILAPPPRLSPTSAMAA